MKKKNLKVVVCGSTGLVGGHLVEELLEKQWISEVHALVRRKSGKDHPKLKEKIVDINSLEPGDFPSSPDVFISCLGTTIKKAGSKDRFRAVDLGYNFEFARMAQKKEASSFLLVSALGADPESKVFYNRIKGETEKKIAALDIPSIHFFRPSILLGNRNEFRPGEKLGIYLARIMGPLLIGPLKKYKAIHAETVAKAMVETLKSHHKEGVFVYESDKIKEIGR